MKYRITLLLFVLLIAGTNTFAQQVATKLAKAFSSTNKDILVAAHRGDWRIAPENSLHALLSCIEQGFDMMELDVKMVC
jgi:glycerophosphoryl diester phosphodiesterase